MKESQTAFQAKVTDERKSALQKYQETVLGRSGFGYLVKFECIMLLCSWVPGDKSPDRIDALVWALTELMFKGGGVTVASGADIYQ